MDPGLGEQIPEVLGADYQGHLVTIENNGKAKMLLFVAHWCGKSAREVQRVSSWLEDHQLPDNVELIAISTYVAPPPPPPSDRYPPSRWLEDVGWTVPVLVDDEKRYTVDRAFGAGGFPHWVMVGPDGTVLDRIEGWDLVDIDERVARLSEL